MPPREETDPLESELTVNWYWVVLLLVDPPPPVDPPLPVDPPPPVEPPLPELIGWSACSTSIFIVSDNSPHPLVFTVDTVIELEPTSVIVPSILYLFPSIE